MKIIHRMMSPVLTLVLALALLAGPLFAETTINQRVDASPSGAVEIENISGSITVIGWEQDAVEVSGTIGDEVEAVSVDRSGDKVSISVELPRRSRGDSSADLEIRIPSGSMVEVETVSAGISVSGVSGRLDLESVSGSVEVDGGNEIEVETVSGKIELSGSLFEVDAETVSGRITLDGREINEASLSSVSGKIAVDSGLSDQAEIEVETVSGDVIFTLPASTAANFKLESFSGDIENKLTGETAERTDRYAPGRKLGFSTGGSAEVDVETHSGDIELRVE